MVPLVVGKPTIVIAGLLLCCSGAIAQDGSSHDRRGTDHTSSPNPLTKVDRTALTGFRERPLFDPARRLTPVDTPTVAPPVSVAPPEPPPSLQLIGVILGARAIALARLNGQDKTIVLRSGDQFSGWSVIILSSVVIRLRNGTRVFDYTLFGKLGEIRQVSAEAGDAAHNARDKPGEGMAGSASFSK